MLQANSCSMCRHSSATSTLFWHTGSDQLEPQLQHAKQRSRPSIDSSTLAFPQHIQAQRMMLMLMMMMMLIYGEWGENKPHGMMKVMTELSGSRSTNCVFFPRTLKVTQSQRLYICVWASLRRKRLREGKEELTSRSEEATGAGRGGERGRVTRRREGRQLSERELSPSDDSSVAHQWHRCALMSLTNGIVHICTFVQEDRERKRCRYECLLSMCRQIS